MTETPEHIGHARAYLVAGMVPTVVKATTADVETEAGAALAAWMRANSSTKLDIVDDQGLKIGTVTLGDDKTEARVSDEKTLLAWCEVEHPEHVETIKRIRPAYLAHLLDVANTESTPVDLATGQQVPGIEMAPKVGGLRRSYNRDAKTRVKNLIETGRLPALAPRPADTEETPDAGTV